MPNAWTDITSGASRAAQSANHGRCMRTCGSSSESTICTTDAHAGMSGMTIAALDPAEATKMPGNSRRNAVIQSHQIHSQVFTTGAHAVDLPVLSVLSIWLHQRQARSREACDLERRRSPLRVWEPTSCRLMRPTPSFSCVDDDRKVGRRCPLVMSCTKQDTRLFLACSAVDP